MPEEYICDTNYYIFKFDNVNKVVEFCKETFPDSTAYIEILEENEGNEAWICVLGICDICNHKNCFFAPACIYESEIVGVECGECGNMSVYPQEGSFENE